MTTDQSLLFYNTYQQLFSTTDFDLVISDEAHRLIGGNARAVFEYFVGYKLGLTATPKDYLRNFDASNPSTNDPREAERRMLEDTCKTFGCESGEPTFRYSLIDGVKDGYLVNPTVVDARTDMTGNYKVTGTPSFQIGDAGGSSPGVLNLAGDTAWGSVNGSPSVRSLFSAKLFRFLKNSDSSVSATIDLDTGVITGKGFIAALTTKTTAYTLTATDSVILANATTAAFTCTLPTAVGITGRQYTIKRINSGANNVTVGCSASQVIDGAATKTLGSQWSTLTVVSDGANWQVVNVLGTVS